MLAVGSPPNPRPIAGRRPLLGAAVALLLTAGCSGQRPELVQPPADPNDGTAAATTLPLPEREACTTIAGPGPARAEIGADLVPCLAVAAHHRMELVNQRATAIDVTVGPSTINLGPQSGQLTEPVGSLLAPGPNRILVGEDTVATVWLVDPGQDPLAGATIDLTSIGDVELGLEPAGVTAAAGGTPVPAAGSPCHLTSLDGDPYSPLFTFRDGQLVVVQVFTPGVATLSGVGIGSSSADIAAAYGDRVESRPAPDGDPARQLFVFRPIDEEDQIYRLVFDVRDDRVTSVRFGATEIVADRPGCGP